ncbi:hypothetical protein Tco_0209689 [Tanacetum coccineum]
MLCENIDPSRLSSKKNNLYSNMEVIGSYGLFLYSKITDNSKKGLGYHAVPPPYLLIYNAPTKLNLSYSGLEEFQQPEFEGYGLRANKSVCENSSNETKKNSDAPLIKEWVSDNEDEVESPVVVWRPVKPNSASITLKRYDYADARGILRSVMAWVHKDGIFSYCQGNPETYFEKFQ